ncbi:DUF3800 domain-containing protein [Rhizobium leguminosarum]|uniref:DUF3800 domain-containing protein n=1 Tax=Rhizobium leguminosarum TaxID=384 RepID=UPI00102F3CD4|nr:DUF3800 domain-containing protein [Rhizobium leguminosarum]
MTRADGSEHQHMYMMYVDESGDTGLVGSRTRYFSLSGLVVHESRWRDLISTLIAFKKTMRAVHGLPVRGEIHASEFINKRPFALPRYTRLAILRNSLDELAKLNYISITNVVVDKQGKPANYDVFEKAWLTLFQRFENTLLFANFPGAHRNDQGVVFTDATSGMKLLRLVRRMAVYNNIPYNGAHGVGARNLPITRIVEDPHGKDSAESVPIQMCDVVAYFLSQRLAPNSYIRSKGAQLYFDRLDPVLNKRASRTNPLGIVML